MATAFSSNQHSQIAFDEDIALCQSALRELRAYAASCRLRSQQAHEEACRMTLYTVALDCEAGGKAIEAYLKHHAPTTLTQHLEQVNEDVKEPVIDEAHDWSPLASEAPHQLG